MKVLPPVAAKTENIRNPGVGATSRTRPSRKKPRMLLKRKRGAIVTLQLTSLRIKMLRRPQQPKQRKSAGEMPPLRKCKKMAAKDLRRRLRNLAGRRSERGTQLLRLVRVMRERKRLLGRKRRSLEGTEMQLKMMSNDR